MRQGPPTTPDYPHTHTVSPDSAPPPTDAGNHTPQTTDHKTETGYTPTPTDESLRGVFNVAGMMDKEGNLYFASGAAHNLNPVDYPRLNIVSLGDPSVIEQLPYEMRLPFHAEQKLLNYVKANNLDVAAIYIYLLACQDLFKSDKYMKIIQSGIMDICNTCDRVMNKSGLFRISDSHFYVTNEMRKILIGDANLFQKSAKFIARGLR